MKKFHESAQIQKAATHTLKCIPPHAHSFTPITNHSNCHESNATFFLSFFVIVKYQIVASRHRCRLQELIKNDSRQARKSILGDEKES